MSTTDRYDAVERISVLIFVEMRRQFPRYAPVEELKIAIDIGAPVSDNRQIGDIHGENALSLIRSVAIWLENAGYLLSTSSGSYRYYCLSEKGAELVGCLPDVIKQPDTYDLTPQD